jgi:hypothetical protein
MVVVCSSERALDLRPVLTRINLIVDGDAGMLPPPWLRTLDAIHLVAAQRAERVRFPAAPLRRAAEMWPFMFAPALNDIDPSGVGGKER